MDELSEETLDLIEQIEKSGPILLRGNNQDKFIRSPHFQIAIKHFHSKANQGDSTAQYYLGHYYKMGFGVARSDEKSFEYLKLAANQGNSDAQLSLGCAYSCAGETEKAIKYLKLAAEQKHPATQTNHSASNKDEHLFNMNNKESIRACLLLIEEGYDFAKKYLTFALTSIFERGFCYGGLNEKELNFLKYIFEIGKGITISIIDSECLFNSFMRNSISSSSMPRNQYNEIARLFLINGANRMSTDKDGRTPYDINSSFFNNAWMLMYEDNMRRYTAIFKHLESILNKDVTIMLLKLMFLFPYSFDDYVFVTKRAKADRANQANQFVISTEKFIGACNNWFFSNDQLKALAEKFRKTISQKNFSNIKKEEMIKKMIEKFLTKLKFTSVEKRQEILDATDALLKHHLITSGDLRQHKIGSDNSTFIWQPPHLILSSPSVDTEANKLYAITLLQKHLKKCNGRQGNETALEKETTFSAHSFFKRFSSCDTATEIIIAKKLLDKLDGKEPIYSHQEYEALTEGPLKKIYTEIIHLCPECELKVKASSQKTF